MKQQQNASNQEDIAGQLERYQKKIANILESFTDAYFEVDRNWTVIYWNAEAERLLSMSRADILGKNLWDVYQEAMPLKFYTEYHHAVREHVAVRFEEYFHPKNLWVEVAAFPTGEGLSVYFKDITEAKKTSQILEEERKKYQDLFNFSPLPQWVYDLETLEILQVNEAAIYHYGYSRDEFLSMKIEDIHTNDSLPMLHDILKTKIKAGEYAQSIVKHQKKNGEVMYVQVEGNSVAFEGRNVRLALIINLTEKIKAEEKLKESLQAIEAQNIRLREISWIQAHGVRAPVAKILGLTELIDSEPAPPFPEIMELAKMIHDSALELDHVVKAILEKSK